MAGLPTIQVQQFRIQFMGALGAVLALFTVIYLFDWRETKQEAIAGFEDAVTSAAYGTIPYLQAGDIAGMQRYLWHVLGVGEPQFVCVYNMEDHLLSHWEAPESKQSCPSFLMREGLERKGEQISIARTLISDGRYWGMLYAGTQLNIGRELLGRNAALLGALMLIAYLSCWYSAKKSAKAIAASLAALEQQIACFAQQEYAHCNTLPPMTTQETQSLESTIRAFRDQLAIITLPRSQLLRQRQHYHALLGTALATVRRHSSADAPLLGVLANYELLLQLEQESKLPNPQQFELATVLKSAVNLARKEHGSASSHVHIQATVQSKLPPQVTGYPHLLQMLLKHLLLVSLGRQKQGAIFLRIEEGASPYALRIQLEDSGTMVQAWKLKQWFSPPFEATTGTTEEGISWLLSGWLFFYLGGEASATYDGERKRLRMQGNLPIGLPQHNIAPSTSEIEKEPAPLLLVVEPAAAMQDTLRALVANEGGRCFFVEDHAQALEWGAALPFSAFLCNAGLPDVGLLAACRLQHLMQEGIVRPAPLWVMLTSTRLRETEPWIEAGAEALLPLPLDPAQLHTVCAQLQRQPEGFFQAYEESLHAELPEQIKTRLSELNREIGMQIHTLLSLMESWVETAPPKWCDQVHAVKSAALSLGYFRLAALMAQIEHALSSQPQPLTASHWADILRCLRSSGFHPSEEATS